MSKLFTMYQNLKSENSSDLYLNLVCFIFFWMMMQEK
jgi:hypothetical protein